MLSEKLKLLRNKKEKKENRRITKSTVSKELGLDLSAYGKWENDTRKPDIVSLTKLANYFNVTTDYLLDNEKEDSLYGEVLEINKAMSNVDENTRHRMVDTLKVAFPKAFEESQSNNSDEKIMYSYEWALDVLETHGVNMFSFLKDNKGLTENDIIEIAKNMEK